MLSKRILMIASTLAGIIAPAGVSAEEESSRRVPAREPLSYRNMGIYGPWQPYFWEGPFDFLVVQGAVIEGKDEAADREQLKAWDESLMKARAHNKRVIVDLLWQHWSPTHAENYPAIETFLANVHVDELYAVTIGEENIFWDGQHEILVDFYHRIKQKYPDLPVYQWYSPTFRGTDWPGFVWPWLPADGWVIDEYWAEPSDFEQAVRRHRMLGLPLIQLIWAAPNVSDIPFHQALFEGQLRVAQKYNVPCGFFCWEGEPKRTWAWDENAAEPFKKVLGYCLEAMKKAQEVAEKDLVDWDVGQPVVTVLEKGAEGEFTYRESFDLRMTSAGTEWHWPKHDFMERSLIRGLRQAQWAPDPSRMIVRSNGPEPVEVSLTQHWSTPNGERCRFSASARVTMEPQASVDVILEASLNGYDWVAKTTQIQEGVLRMDVPGVQSDLYTRLRIAGKSEQSAAPLAAIDWIEVRGNSVIDPK